ncbi:putative aflatoxin biosynthesis ketoreductase nor-1 [Trematosphaeria pertusa]|uniref:Putative aflatoxin biosynthesis ketoreductase nor-1 n=1 Tax=Trematosphaeria pertusa TaxID=390896 RepID=A0A6A6I1J7_9PLEO|nr:putative aflatoxin biosynthesis ketoreductase nor-1 [Trematosphaeria pertusa]KAF2244374.1 putative aflatoxin biosynthesis ketoreductase nor-1 [Trematosphaeria pertusa]
MAEQQVVLITGPNRGKPAEAHAKPRVFRILTVVGIGRALLEAFLGRPNHTVIAAVRDPNAAVSQDLKSIPAAEGSKLVLVKIDSAVDTDAQKAVTELQSDHGITTLDVVIANAGIGDHATTVTAAAPESVRRHLDVNVVGVLTLFQAVEPLLRKSPAPKFFTMSTNLASLNLMEYIPGPWFCYGVSKAAMNFLTRKIHFENEWLTAVVLSPGWVQTDMGEFAARAVGLEAAPLKLEDSIKGVLQVVSAEWKNERSRMDADARID